MAVPSIVAAQKQANLERQGCAREKKKHQAER